MVNIIPKRLELLLIEVVVQRIFLNLRFVAITDHIVKGVFVEDALDKRMDALRNFRAAFRNGSKYAVRKVSAVFIGNMIVLIDIVVLDEVTVDIPSLLIGNSDIVAADNERLANKIFRRSLGRTFVKVVTDAFLQIGNEVFIPIRSNNGQLVDLLHLTAECISIHTIAVLIHAKTQATANLLTFLRRGTATMLQGANLKYIRVIPAFTQCRVRENETHRITERK